MPPGTKLTQPHFDESRWPIIVITLPAVALDGDAFEKYLADVSQYYGRGQSFGLVFDIRQAPPLSAPQRRRISEEIDRSAREHAAIRVVQGIVIVSAVQRGIVKAINWLTRQPVETSVFGSVDEAVSWAENALQSRTTVGKQRAG
jgi:hypothetical protein